MCWEWRHCPIFKSPDPPIEEVRAVISTVGRTRWVVRHGIRIRSKNQVAGTVHASKFAICTPRCFCGSDGSQIFPRSERTLAENWQSPLTCFNVSSGQNKRPYNDLIFPSVRLCYISGTGPICWNRYENLCQHIQQPHSEEFPINFWHVPVIEPKASRGSIVCQKWLNGWTESHRKLLQSDRPEQLISRKA